MVHTSWLKEAWPGPGATAGGSWGWSRGAKIASQSAPEVPKWSPKVLPRCQNGSQNVKKDAPRRGCGGAAAPGPRPGSLEPCMSHEPSTINNRLLNELFDYILWVLCHFPKFQSFKIPKFQSFKFRSCKISKSKKQIPKLQEC